mmetsp:Transcript_3887/g.11248  ORF Transcript_3887/g.11248 Transcript_3887/m.11248 type:complete len:102 (-) Transcript_3887:908-1213(-)
MAEEDIIPTSSVLYAAHKHIGERCKEVSMTFLRCKKRDLDPSVCLKEGEAVMICMGKVLKDLRASCKSSMDTYEQCLDRYSNDLRKCRAEEEVFDAECPKP